MKSMQSDLQPQRVGASSAMKADEWSAPGEPRAWLSALLDGDAQGADEACRLWREDEDARKTWHTYQLIGDVMRSDELASRPSHDASFLAGVRARLAAEPVVLAPDTVSAGASAFAASAGRVKLARRRQPWLMPVAAAAGVAVVAGVLVVTRLGVPGDMGGPVVADQGLQLVSGQATGVQPMSAPTRLNGQAGGSQVFLRDARLDEYLRVHNVSRGGVAVAAPGASLQPIPVAAPALNTGR